MAFFWHLFLEALAFVRNFKMQKFLHFLEKQTPKKNKKKCCQKFNSKWRPKLNLLENLQIIFVQKKKIQGCFSCLNT
jgi:hypothetical protein